MREISNRTIVVLLIVAVLVTIGSVATILSRLNFGIDLLTGMATVQYGTVNVTISATAAISMVYANMSFGSGTLNVPPLGTEVVNTTINSTQNYATSYNSFQASISGIVYRNDGNVPVNVSYTGTAAGLFIGGTGSAFKINITNQESGACTYIPFNSSRPEHLQYNLSSDVLATSQTICNVSNYANTQDEVNISVWLWIPSDTQTGLKNATLTLTAVAT